MIGSSVTLIACLLLVALLAGGSMAVRSASRIWLRHWAERRLRGSASVLGYLERPQKLLAAATGAMALTLAFAGAYIGWRAPGAASALWTLLVYAALVVVPGYIVPRAVARRWPSAVIPVAMPVLQVAELLVSPLLTIGRVGRPHAAERSAHDEEPREAMQDLLREGELEGVGGREEIAIISGVMEFGEKTVRDVMTARQEIFALPETLAPRDVATRIAESAFSRVPVYRGSLDQVVGMYHAFDVLKEPLEQLPPLRPVASAAADTRCNELLFRMLRARMHLAVVHDSAGHTLGIVTLENLLEELVGDIRDEHDDPAGAAHGAART